MEVTNQESGTLQEQLLSKSSAAINKNQVSNKKRIIESGRRKTAIARIRLVPGTGVITINGKDVNTYFKIKELQAIVSKPLAIFQQEKQFNIFANVRGGGTRGQAEAICLAVAKSYCANNEESRKQLRSHGLLTRDPRMVERKKYGLHKARRAPQFSKR